MDYFKIYIDRLSENEEELIDFVGSCDFLEINEPELHFDKAIKIQGKAYVAGQEFILQLKAHTKAFMPCKVCNSTVSIDVSLHNFYHVQPTAEIPSRIFDFSTLLREEILLFLPQFVECNEGSCNRRNTIKQFFKKEISTNEKEGHRPFVHLCVAMETSEDVKLHH